MKLNLLFTVTLIIPLRSHVFYNTKTPDVETYDIKALLELYLTPIGEGVSEACNNASRFYLDKLEDDMTILSPKDRWVYKMFDASAKIPKTGVMQGHLSFPGNFDSCLEVVSTSENQNFRGKHCMIQGLPYGGFATTSDNETRQLHDKIYHQYTRGKDCWLALLLVYLSQCF